MLSYFIGRVHQQSVVPMPRPRVVIGIPCGATEVEKRAVFDATMAAGAREVYLIEEPTAASLGAGLPMADVRGSMMVDIGGGTTEVAIHSMGGIVVSRSLRVAGDELDQDIYFATIWSLSKIGGELVQETLESLLDRTNDEEEVDLLETALDNLAFTEGTSIFQMFDFDITDEDELRQRFEEDDESEEDNKDQ